MAPYSAPDATNGTLAPLQNSCASSHPTATNPSAHDPTNPNRASLLLQHPLLHHPIPPLCPPPNAEAVLPKRSLIRSSPHPIPSRSPNPSSPRLTAGVRSPNKKQALECVRARFYGMRCHTCLTPLQTFPCNNTSVVGRPALCHRLSSASFGLQGFDSSMGDRPSSEICFLYVFLLLSNSGC